MTDTTVWQVAVYCEKRGEMQALGIGDGERTLFYTFYGDQLPEGTNWWTVYQGAFPPEQWIAYLLPIGEDWYATHGYYPVITHLIYVNDNDEPSQVETISETNTLATTTTQAELESLPINRTPLQAVNLAPGVANTGPSTEPSIMGAMTFENLYLINGVEVNENIRGQFLPLFIEDAIQETTTTTSGVSTCLT